MHPSKTAGSPSNITPATPLVAHPPQVHERGPDGAGVLPGMIPTPFLATCGDSPDSARGADTVLGGDACGDDVAGRAMEQIRLLWAQIQATRGTKSTSAAAHGGVPNFSLGEDLQAALAGMDGDAADESGKGLENGRTGDAPQQSGVRRDACVATQGPSRPACKPDELAPVAEAFARPNRGFAMNRLSGAGRLSIVGNHVASRVGGVGVGTETGMAAGTVAPDGVAWDRHASGMQGRGLKRERSKMTIVVDYNPNHARPELQPRVPPADKIHFYAKKAMHLLLRSCAAHGVTYWPTDNERNVALLVVLRCHYDVCQLDVDRAMDNGAYSKVVNKIWSKFRSDSSSHGRRRIVDGLEIEVAATGIYKLEIDIDTKKDLQRKYAPSECRGWYDPVVGGFRWGAEHLYVNASDLEEFKPVQYGGKMDPGGDTDEPWLA
ncbi:unnamed protein product [Closterium sp. Naga37s-1]|nr:unnamed protein product [Closterium sp. Naga37s-1]